MTKRYDKPYFDKWYRDPGSRMWAKADVERKVRMALGIAEFVLDRKVKSVLDVGCGEGSWRAILRRIRPGIRYQGVDNSAYVVERFGRQRNIIRGRLANLGALGLKGPFDLVVCCDVLHYVATPELKTGLAAIAELAYGPCYLEAYTSADDVAGNHGYFQRRTPALYRKLLRQAGFVQTGPHFFVEQKLAHMLVALERAGN